MKTKLAFDIETYDPNLKKLGPGNIRRDGFIIGIGIYCPDRNIHEFYRPTDPKVREILADPTTDKIAHNALYDVEWLVNGEHHFTINGLIEDTLTREALLDPYSRYFNLDYSCEKRGIAGKNKSDTIDAYWKGKGKAIEHLHEIPFDIVGKYCKQDCKATYDLYFIQEPLMEQNHFDNVYSIECRLYPWLMHTRANGMRLDWQKRQILSDMLNQKRTELQAYWDKTYGGNYNSAARLRVLFNQLGIPLQYRYGTNNVTFDAKALTRVDHDIARTILQIKMFNKLIDTYIDGQFVDCSYNGRLYPVLYPAKADDGGTVTGRFSSAHPNGQNISARAEKFGNETRALFIPEDDCLIGAFDYKQIEYRIFTHYASTIRPAPKGIEEAVKKYNTTAVDYHSMVQEMMGWNYDDPEKKKTFRHITKNLNFGAIYGLGSTAFARDFGHLIQAAHPDVTKEQLPQFARVLMNEYYERIPFIKTTMRSIEEKAIKQGYITSISGRRPRLINKDKSYVMVNYLVQGTAGDIFKKAMVDAWEGGVFNVLKCHMMIHDECLFSMPKTKEGVEAAQALSDYMRNAYKLNIPIGVDTEMGTDWSNCVEDTFLEMKKKFNIL